MSAELLRATLFCSDINERTIISVCPDNAEDDFILVTCRTCVKRYNILHRIPANSWSTKSWNPYTSGATRCSTSKLISAVIDEVYLCQWGVEQTDSYSIKKQKFKSRIHELINSEDDVFVVFSDGHIQPLSSALASRKEEKPCVIQQNEKILTCKLLQQNTSAAFLIQHKDGVMSLCLSSISKEESVVPTYVNISHGIHKPIAYTILSTGKLVTLWNDGNLFSLNLLKESGIIGTVPGTRLERITKLKANKRSNMLELTPNHIAIQGMDVNEEGGLLLLFDLKFGLVVSAKPLKMYKDPPLSWRIQNAIVIVQGGSLCYVPYEIKNSTLASMFGSKISDPSNSQVLHITNLSNDSSICDSSHSYEMYTGKSPAMTECLKKLPSEAFSQDIICSHVIKEAIESKDNDLMTECLDTFHTIPEKSLLAVLKYILTDVDDLDPLQDSPHLETLDETTNQSEELCPVLSLKKMSVINKMMLKPISTKIMKHYLPLLQFDASLKLISHLHYLINQDKICLVAPESNELSMHRACMWLSLLLDANYHQLVMTSEVEIHKKLLSCLDHISNLQSFLESTNEIDPLLERILHSKPIKAHRANALYSVERIVIL